MITVDLLDQPAGVLMRLAAPFTTQDIDLVAEKLRTIQESRWRRLLVEVDSIKVPDPKTMWEDIKLTPKILMMHAVAIVTDIEWYGRLAAVTGALTPGLVIKHFEPGDRAAALAWLSTFDD